MDGSMLTKGKMQVGLRTEALLTLVSDSLGGGASSAVG